VVFETLVEELKKGQFMGSRRKGFTLIELLVVIAIIALLMSILMPALRNVRDQAKDSICKQRLQQWGVMFNMYASEWDGRLMGWANYAWYGGEFVEHAWIPMMYDYAKGFDIYLCPAATRTWGEGEDMMSHIAAWDFQYLQDEFAMGEWFPYYRVGGDDNPIYAYGSYGKNEFVTYTDVVNDTSEYYMTIRVKNVAKIPLLGCSLFLAGFPDAWDEPSPVKYHHPFDNRWLVDRHHLAINMVNLDWSVRKVGLKQLWQLRWNRQKHQDGSSAWGHPNVVPDPYIPEEWPEWMRNAKNYDL
jgi:prepilin-type N-terminal cleavage/methylation domain-containing protein